MIYSDGSYYYQNQNGSRYYNSGDGFNRYTDLSGNVRDIMTWTNNYPSSGSSHNSRQDAYRTTYSPPARTYSEYSYPTVATRGSGYAENRYSGESYGRSGGYETHSPGVPRLPASSGYVSSSYDYGQHFHEHTYPNVEQESPNTYHYEGSDGEYYTYEEDGSSYAGHSSDGSGPSDSGAESYDDDGYYGTDGGDDYSSDGYDDYDDYEEDDYSD
jgi:hypothetical protein